ncbi:MAG: hypothetical protein J1F25_08350, partial [Prevotellaceae bacterium]|nr:hypothetical protein [Prevotellaceae bacterium]
SVPLHLRRQAVHINMKGCDSRFPQQRYGKARIKQKSTPRNLFYCQTENAIFSYICVIYKENQR